MKNLFFLAVTVCTILSSCSKVEDDSNGQNNNQTNNQFIVKSSSIWGWKRDFSYDEQGRIINIMTDYGKRGYGYSDITYNGNYMTVKYSDEYMSGTFEAELNKDGYVTEAKEEHFFPEESDHLKFNYTYTYDKSGYLIKIVEDYYRVRDNGLEPIEKNTTTIEWLNGNPKRMEYYSYDYRDEDDCYTAVTIYKYTPVENNSNYYPLAIEIYNNCHYVAGSYPLIGFNLFGKLPTNLLAGYNYDDGSEKNYDVSYTYIFNDNGSVAEVIENEESIEQYWY